MPNTPNRNWPYPNKGKTPWYQDWETFVNAADSDVQQNVTNISGLETAMGDIQTFKPDLTNPEVFEGDGPHEITAEMSGKAIACPAGRGAVLRLPDPAEGLCYFISGPSGGGDDYIVVDGDYNDATSFIGPHQSVHDSTWTDIRVYGKYTWIFVFAYYYEAGVYSRWLWWIWDGVGCIADDDNPDTQFFSFTRSPQDLFYLNRREEVDSTPYILSNLGEWKNLLGVTETADNAVDIIIPSKLIAIPGWEVTIVDEGGNASTNNITIQTEKLEEISGQATWTINGDYNAVTLYSDGANLFVK